MSEISAFRGGKWRPACPLPLYVRSWRTWFRWRYVCECGDEFRTEEEYRVHWVEVADRNG